MMPSACQEQRLATDVAVLGGGLAGLSAALAFARSGRRVTLIERDGAIEDGSADELFDDWERPGIAHFRQPHNFLGLARRVLLDEAPDVLDAVLGLGAVENRQYELLPGAAEAQDELFVSIWARRPVFESALRRAVEDEADINAHHQDAGSRASYLLHVSRGITGFRSSHRSR